MTRDEIIGMAMDVGLMDKVDNSDDYFIRADAFDDEIVRFAELAAAAERERCAQLCDAYAMPDGTSETALALAAAIRRMK